MTLDTYADANKDALIVAADKLSSTFRKEGDFLDPYDESEEENSGSESGPESQAEQK